MIQQSTQFTDIKLDHDVVLYPSFGCWVDRDKNWRIHVEGAVFEPADVNLRKRLMLRLLQRAMKVQPEALDSEIFRERIRGFIAAPDRGRRLAVRVGEGMFRLQKKSKRNGQFSGTLRISPDQLQKLKERGDLENDWLKLQIVVPHTDRRLFVGRIKLIDGEGWSVISDIDDTIKHTQVESRRSLLANTFLREFRSISGMSQLYSHWSASGAVFHYVSSSPWQLFSPLSEYCKSDGFPQGTFHLRSFRLRDHMLRRLLLIRRKGKAEVIHRLLRAFPNRKFVLIGDSGERDPEIYGRLAARHRNVRSIFIRNLPHRPMESPRVRRVFRRVPDANWSVYEDASELPKVLG